MTDTQPTSPTPAQQPSDRPLPQVDLAAIPPAVLQQALQRALAEALAKRGPFLPGGTVNPLLMGGPAALMQTQVQAWAAPYPPPDAVERYEKVLPGTFNRLISMAEQLQAAQIDDSRRAQLFTQSDQKRGHYLGAASTIIAMAFALLALRLGSTIVAGLFLSVPVMAVGKAFIDSTNQRAALKSAAESVPLTQPTAPPPANESQKAKIP